MKLFFILLLTHCITLSRSLYTWDGKDWKWKDSLSTYEDDSDYFDGSGSGSDDDDDYFDNSKPVTTPTSTTPTPTTPTSTGTATTTDTISRIATTNLQNESKIKENDTIGTSKPVSPGQLNNDKDSHCNSNEIQKSLEQVFKERDELQVQLLSKEMENKKLNDEKKKAIQKYTSLKNKVQNLKNYILSMFPNEEQMMNEKGKPN